MRYPESKSSSMMLRNCLGRVGGRTSSSESVRSINSIVRMTGSRRFSWMVLWDVGVWKTFSWLEVLEEDWDMGPCKKNFSFIVPGPLALALAVAYINITPPPGGRRGVSPPG